MDCLFKIKRRKSSRYVIPTAADPYPNIPKLLPACPRSIWAVAPISIFSSQTQMTVVMNFCAGVLWPSISYTICTITRDFHSGQVTRSLVYSTRGQSSGTIASRCAQIFGRASGRTFLLKEILCGQRRVPHLSIRRLSIRGTRDGAACEFSVSLSDGVRQMTLCRH